MFNWHQTSLVSVFLFCTVFAFGMPVSGTASAQTTADCGRFFLKKNKKTGQMECVNKKSTRSRSRISASGIQQRQRAVGQILNQAARISQQQDLTDEDRRRVKELLSEANQRVKEIQRQTDQLRQEQQTRSKALASEQNRRLRQQVEASRALELQQKTLTLQLIAQQRQFSKDARGR